MQKTGNKNLANNAAAEIWPETHHAQCDANCEARRGEPRRLLWSNKMPATDQREGGADTMQSGCSSPRENQNKRELRAANWRLETASWQLATANCELPTAEPNSHQFFFGQSVAGFELWLDLTSLFLGSTAIFLLVFLSNLLLLLFLVSFWLFCRQTGAWLLRMRVSQNWPNVYKRL